MKTAISLPTQLFEEAERLARRLKKSRSKVYREAITEYVARHDPDALAEKLNEVVDRLDAPRDEFVARTARRVLEQTDW